MGIIDELKIHAREIERELEARLDDLEKIHLSINPDDIEVSSGQYPESKLQVIIDRLLDQLKQISDQMNKESITQVEKSLTSTYIQAQKSSLQRYKTANKAIENKRWQQQLLGKQLINNDNSKIDILLKEEKYLDESLETGRNILNTANEVRVSFAYQSKKLSSTSDKIVRFAEALPGINYLMKRISSRKKFNALVLGLATAICICIILYKIL